MARPIDDIAKVLTQAISDAIKDREGELKAIAEAGGAKAGEGFLGDIGSLAKIITDIALTLTLGEFGVPGAIGLAKTVEDAGGKLGRGYGIGYLLGYSAYQSLQPLFLVLQHAIADLVQTEIHDPQTAAQLASRGIISADFARSEAAGGNLDGTHENQLIEAALQHPELAQLLDMWNRELISETDVNTSMQRHGIPAHLFAPLKALRRTLLSPADLALANLRGEITAETMQGYANQLGVDRNDMQVLIGNTGEPPGPEQLMEALRRGFIDQARFDRGIRQSRVRNEWIDVEFALRQSPMSTSDAVRAVIENYISDDEGKHIAEQNGLIPEHWEPLRQSWGRPLSHEQMMTLYHRGEATLDEVRQAFRESDLKNQYIDQAIKLGRHLVPERTIVSMLNHGVINHDRAMTMLTEQGFDPLDAESLIKLGTAERVQAHKELSRSDLIAMYEDSLLTKEQVVAHLVKLGYDHADAEAMVQLADIKKHSAVLKTFERGVEASLKAHHVTEREAVSELEKVGLSTREAQQLVDQWIQQRGTVTRTLSEAQVLKLAKDGLLTADDARARLMAMGLSRGDSDLLLIDRGVLPAPK